MKTAPKVRGEKQSGDLAWEYPPASWPQAGEGWFFWLRAAILHDHIQFAVYLRECTSWSHQAIVAFFRS